MNHPNSYLRPPRAPVPGLDDLKRFIPKIAFPKRLSIDGLTAGRKVEEAIDVARKAIAGGKSPDLKLGEKTMLRVALWALNKVLKGAGDENDVRDLVQAVDGVVGFAKRRFAVGHSARAPLEAADKLLDEAHESLGHAE